MGQQSSNAVLETAVIMIINEIKNIHPTEVGHSTSAAVSRYMIDSGYTMDHVPTCTCSVGSIPTECFFRLK